MADDPALKQHKIKRYGWVPDVPDHRDHLYSATSLQIAKLPSKVDLRAHMPPVYDQLDVGGCTGNAIAAAVQYDRLRQSMTPQFRPSRLFIYYNERVIENSVPYDAGAMIRDGIKSIAQVGVCPEEEWPYETTKFAQQPPANVYQDALQYKAVSYSRVPNTLTQMKGCLASGFPFVFGFSVYDSFESDLVARTGVLQLPLASESLLGGHAVLAVGYDEGSHRFIVRNSWGSAWGQKGYFTMPYAYLTDSNLADDFWTVRVISH